MKTTIAERLGLLRERMQAEGIDAYLVPTADYHGSEYVAPHFRCREYLTGFTGSAGTLLVLRDRALLWTDGRYFLQAAQQLAGSGVELMRAGMPQTPTVEQFLETVLPSGGVFAVDGRTISVREGRRLSDALEPRGIRMRTDADLSGQIWAGRPDLPQKPVWLLAPEFAGESAAEKLRWLREKMDSLRAEVCVLSNCEDISWLLNIRGGDLPCTPVPLCYCAVERERLTLFLAPGQHGGETDRNLVALGAAFEDYGAVYPAAERLPGGTRVLIDEKRLNCALWEILRKRAETVDCPDLIALRRSVKNRTEMENLRQAHLRDGVALTQFMFWLKHPEDWNETPDELSAAAWLDRARSRQEGFLDLSFETICGYGSHAAVIHYMPDAKSSIPFEPHGLVLVDSGAQYLQGTTDVTRTYALGPVTQEERLHYTLVLKGMLALMSVRFPAGTTGGQLDALARAPLWAHGLDFRHGTGHGIGYLLCVHEDPVRITPKGDVGFRPGMVVSDEPGVYIPHQHGIRLENQLLCVPDRSTEYGDFLRFDTLTLSPVDLDAADPTLLTMEERAVLNAYHARVREALSPLLDRRTRAWLADAARSV